MIPLHQNATVRRIAGRWLAPLGMSLCVIAPMLGAQTRFALRDTTPDVAKYRSPEECLAGSERLVLKAKRELPFWPDTMVVVQGKEFDSLPANVKDFTSRCLKKFNPDSVDMKRYALWLRLYLQSGQDTIASSIAQRRLATTAWSSEDTSQRLAPVLNDIVGEYGDARPYRGDLIRTLVASYLEGPNRPSDIEHLMPLYSQLVNVNRRMGDSATALSLAQQVVALSDSLTDEQKATDFYKKSGAPLVASARDFLGAEALLDSLRKSSKAYVALKRAFWKDVSGWGKEYIAMIGETARPLVGEFVFSPTGERLVAADSGAGASSPTVGAYPRRGRPSLVIFLYGGCREETAPAGATGKSRPSFSSMCLDTYTIMHRIARQYPGVDITVVSRTTGYVGNVGPLTPTEEADLLKSWWLGHHRLPATLVIANTQFFRLPGLDRRRIDQPDENAANYTFLDAQRRRGDMTQKSAFLIDADGAILEYGFLTPDTEKRFGEILDIITKRPQ